MSKYYLFSILKCVEGVDLMNQFTLDNVINSATKEIVLKVMVDVLGMDKERKPVIAGFRNIKLESAPENRLKNALLVKLKDFKWSEYDFKEEPNTLEEFEEKYNIKKYICFAHILIAVASGHNVNIAFEAYKKLFVDNVEGKIVEETSQEVVSDNIADEFKELKSQHETLKAHVASLIADLGEKTQNVEKLKKEKKEQKQSIKLFEKMCEIKDKIIKEQENVINEFKAKDMEGENHINELLQSKDNEILRLVTELESEKKKNAELQEQLNELNHKEQLYTVVYGYNESLYKCTCGKFVYQPNDDVQLVQWGKQYKIKEIFYRESSLNIFQLKNIRNNFPDILIEPKELKDLIALGYLERKGGQ